MMLTCKTSLACAFALISSVSAGLIPGGFIGSDPLAQVAAPIIALIPSGGGSSCVTGLVPVAPGSNALSAGPKAIGDLTSVATSNIVSTTSVNGVVAIVGNTVAGVASLASDGISTLTNGFPGFTNSIVLSCAYGDIMVSPASNGIEVPVDQAASAPSCFTDPSFSGEHILIMIGPDPHGAQTLHFVQPDELSSSSIVPPIGPVAFSSSKAPAVEYLGPVGSGLDTYTLLLFSQPADFKLSDFHDSDRYGFDITTFASKHALGVPVAAIYFVSGNKNGNGVSDGKFHNGTVSSTNGTLHGSYGHGHGNGTNNSTVHSGNFHGNTSSSSHSNSSADPSTPLPSSSGNVPVSPDAVDTHSLSKASAYAANFALAGFVALISVGVLSL